MINQLIINNKGEVYRSAEFDAIAKEILDAKSKGIYQPFKPDGTFNLLPQTQKIIIDGRLRRTLGRRANES
jgi:microcystin degradation protein MlrC